MDKAANFLLRLLAKLTDIAIIFVPHSLFWLYLSQSTNISNLIINAFTYLLIVAIPSLLLNTLFYDSWLTTHLGGTPGKLLTGLRVTDDAGKLLPFKKSLFRHTVGYGFSSILFGLGYWAILKDPNNLAWHDKTIGSKVTITKTIWPISLVVLLALMLAHLYLITSSINQFNKGPVKTAITDLVTTFQNSTKNANKQPEASPSSLPLERLD